MSTCVPCVRVSSGRVFEQRVHARRPVRVSMGACVREESGGVQCAQSGTTRCRHGICKLMRVVSHGLTSNWLSIAPQG